MLEATRLLWRIQLDPERSRRDAAFDRRGDARRSTRPRRGRAREPRQRRGLVLPRRRLRRPRAVARAAAGSAWARRATASEIKHALDRTLALDPALVDAQFGLGLYEYYADVAPTARQDPARAADAAGRRSCARPARACSGRGSARRSCSPTKRRIQLHVVYFWYENRAADALALLARAGRAASAQSATSAAPIAERSRRLPARHERARSPAGASWRALADTDARERGARWRDADAHLGYATALDALGDTDLALAELDAAARVARRSVPWGITQSHRARPRPRARSPRPARRGRGAAAPGDRVDRAQRSAGARRRRRGACCSGRRPSRRAAPIGSASRRGARSSADADGAGAVALRGGDRARSGQRRHAAALRARAGGAAADRAGDRRARRGARAPRRRRRRRRSPRPRSLAGRLREQQHDRRHAIAAYRRAASTFGAAAETRNAATRAIERLERSRIRPAVSLKFRRRCADILEHHPLI